MTVSALVDARPLLEFAQKAGAKQIPQAIGAALGRAARSTRVAVSDQIRSPKVPGSWSLKAGYVKSRVTISVPRATEAPTGAHTATLIAKGGPIPLGVFGKPSMTKRGASFRIVRGSKRQVYRAEGRAGFLVGKRTDGGRTKTGRKRSGKFVPSTDEKYAGKLFWNPPGSARGKLYVPHGPGIAQKVAGRKMRKVIRTTWERQFPKEFNAAIKNRIRIAQEQARKKARPRIRRR